jgi:hypothetical protein
MQPRAVLGAGIALTLLGALVNLAAGQDQGTRILASLLAALGLLVLALSLWALSAAPASPLLLGGAALFVVGRLLLIFLPFDPTLFAGLTVLNALGTVLLFVGVWHALQPRLAPGTAAPALPAAPKPVPAAAKPAPRPPGTPARVGSIRPAQPVQGSPPPRKPG